MDKDILTEIGDFPIAELTPPSILAMLKVIEARGAFELANRARQYTSKVMQYAVASGKAERDYTLDLSEAQVDKEGETLTGPQYVYEHCP